MTPAEPGAHQLRAKPRNAAELRILAAALDLFAEHGVSGTSLQMIADAVGVAKGAVYYRFKTKDEIVVAVTEMQLARLEEALEAAEAAEAEGNRARGRELLLTRVIELAVENRRIVSVLQFDPVVIRFLGEHTPFHEFLERLYLALIGDETGPQALLRAAMLRGAIGSAVMHPLVAVLDDDTLRDELLNLTRHLIDLPTR
ncbi:MULTISPECIES: helix-turn-helix domain-containing protein [unclassified Mycobacterium]|uniref:TetR/AcrR family transcriptional regulator n=1 Tax=unclassified Mycobacterium TaxID=2642494 RepID=UPI0029C63739|nr:MULTISPECIES: helix-turn-helix domain-containing protein [unclassified Mycobacterium]